MSFIYKHIGNGFYAVGYTECDGWTSVRTFDEDPETNKRKAIEWTSYLNGGTKPGWTE